MMTHRAHIRPLLPSCIEDRSRAQLPLQPTRLLPSLRVAIRAHHYSAKTEAAYVHWVRRFIFFHGVRHPKDMGAAEITAFLNHLAPDHQVAAATQNQALAALLFLYKIVLGCDLPWLDAIVRAKAKKRLPCVPTRIEVQAILSQLTGTRWLTLQRSVKDAVAAEGINKPISCHTLRHAFATHLLESGHNIRVVQELLGHKDVETTLIHTHVMQHNLADVRCPADMMTDLTCEVARGSCLQTAVGDLRTAAA